MSHDLNSLKGVMRDYIGTTIGVIKTRSLEYSTLACHLSGRCHLYPWVLGP